MFLYVKFFTPTSCLYKAARFAVAGSCALFLGVGLLEYVKLRKPTLFRYLKYLSPNELFAANTRLNAYNRLSRGHRCTLAIIVINICVCFAWKVKSFRKVMSKLFVCRFSPHSIPWPVLFSVFSHHDLFRLALNMSILGESAPGIIDRFLGVNEFCCFYLTAGMLGSLASLTGSHFRGHYMGVSMGATSTISAVFVYRLVKQPDAQVGFLGVLINARVFVLLYMLIDLTGLLCTADGVAEYSGHLGGSLFGLFYAEYGEALYRKYFPAGRHFGDALE